ncbi:endopeptidase, putative [Plasmodium gallinaceum]|uniref:Endopeptidase, putative n=1 Tax=Plasmodium gallinaceum TaxID=5849 RepID=A0A1J1GUU7_PLAGA|nr:endopeptidase, putative [Plasmodium gallinaceum]CRG95080.1 endopeptidase, putative [Plasmodium gallinaceum]
MNHLIYNWTIRKNDTIRYWGTKLNRNFFFKKFNRNDISKILEKIKLKNVVKNENKELTLENNIRLDKRNNYNSSTSSNKFSESIDQLNNDDINAIDSILQKVEKKNKKNGGFLLELIGITSHSDSIINSSIICIQNCDKILNNIYKENNIFKIINMIDTVSNNLCKLGDALELLRNLHNNKITIEKAHSALENLTNYIDRINIDQNIYNFLKKKYNENIKLLDNEHKEVLKNMLISMENQGVHIKDEKKKKNYLELQSYEKNFSFHASSNFCSEYDGIYLDKRKLLKHIDENIIKDYEQKIIPLIKNNKIKINPKYSLNDYIYLIQDSSFVMTILERVDDENIANSVYNLLKKPNNMFLNNILILHYYRNMLISYRGFKNYSEYSLKSCILNTPTKVNYFLKNFLENILPYFFKELEFIEKFISISNNKLKQSNQNDSIKSTDNNKNINFKDNTIDRTKNNSNNVAKLCPSNIFYYMNKIKEVKLKKIEEQMNNNLNLYDVIKFVIKLLKDTYSLEMVNVIPLKNELWDENILKFEIKKENYIYGYIYMDLFERENKNHSIAQYTVRCSKNMNICLKYKWLEENVDEYPFFYSGIVKNKDSNNIINNYNDNSVRNNTNINIHNIYRQITSTFLVCNFNINLKDEEDNTVDINNCNDEFFRNNKVKYFLSKIKMSIDKVNMFLHEFGHTLHCILSSTYLQHLSGNRSGVDFSEFSSHFFEEYLNNYDSLLLLYSKNKNEENMKFLLKSYMRNKNIICYYSLVQITIQSIIDQIFYSFSHCTDSIIERKQLIENEIKKYFSNIYYKDIFILDLFPQIHFSKTSHLIHYPSNYYSYLYCSVLSKYIWNRIFNNNFYNKDKANKIIQFLQGGSVDSTLKNIVSLVEDDKAKIDYFTQNPHMIPLDDFLSYYEDNKDKYNSFLENL